MSKLINLFRNSPASGVESSEHHGKKKSHLNQQQTASSRPDAVENLGNNSGQPPQVSQNGNDQHQKVRFRHFTRLAESLRSPKKQETSTRSDTPGLAPQPQDRLVGSPYEMMPTGKAPVMQEQLTGRRYEDMPQGKAPTPYTTRQKEPEAPAQQRPLDQLENASRESVAGSGHSEVSDDFVRPLNVHKNDPKGKQVRFEDNNERGGFDPNDPFAPLSSGGDPFGIFSNNGQSSRNALTPQDMMMHGGIVDDERPNVPERSRNRISRDAVQPNPLERHDSHSSQGTSSSGSSSQASGQTETSSSSSSSSSTDSSASAEAAHSKNPFRRLNYWATHHSDGTPTTRLQKFRAKPEELPPLFGKGVQFDLKKGDKGQLEFNTDTSPQMRELLSKTVGAHGRTFNMVQSSNSGSARTGESRAILRDNDGFTHHVRSDELGMAAYHSVLAASVVNTGVKLDAPDFHHDAHVHGIHRDGDNAFKMHNGELKQFNFGASRWENFEIHDGQSWSHLSSNANQVTGVVHDGTHYSVSNLNNPDEPLFMSDQPIVSHHMDADGRLIVLQKGPNGDARVSITTRNDDGTPNTITSNLRLMAHNIIGHELTADAGIPQNIAISGDHMYIADGHGEFYSLTVDEVTANAGNERPIPMRHHTSGFREYDKEHRLAGFFTDGKGVLNAILKGGNEHPHSCPEVARGDFGVGWNLGDALATYNSQGLETENPNSRTVHFDRFGSLRVNDGKLQYRDALTKNWQEMQTGDVREVSRGLDGFSYVLQGGQIRSLDYTEGTNSQFMGANIYELGIQRNKPGFGPQLKGGKADDNYVSAAIVNSHEYVGLNAEGNIRVVSHSRAYHGALGTPEALTKRGIPADQTLKQVQFDENENLIALTEQGDAYMMTPDQWRRKDPNDISWQQMPFAREHDFAEGEPFHLSVDGDSKLTMTRGNDHFSVQNGRWTALENHQGQDPDVTRRTRFDEAFDRLQTSMKTKTVHGRSLNVTASIVGSPNAERGKVQSRFRDRLRAHYFKPTMEVPRSMKIAGDAIQHAFRGREGLRPLYDESVSLHYELDALQTHNLPKRGNMTERVNTLESFASRLPTNSLNPETAKASQDFQRMLDEITLLRDELDRSSLHTLSLVAAKAKVVDAHGQIKAKPHPKHQERMSHTKGHNLTTELRNIWNLSGMTDDQSATAALLNLLSERNVQLGHSRPDIPFGRQRDTADKASLAKARLALNTLTLHKVSEMLVRMEDVMNGHASPTKNQMDRIRADFVNLRDQQYRNSDVRMATEMGHADYNDIEANYDTIKSFGKAFSKEDHGVAMTSRSALDAPSKEELRGAMKEIISALREGESISFGRSYEGGVNTVYNPVNQLPIFSSVVAGLSSGVARSLTVLRDDGNLVVNMGRNKVQGISAGGFFGQNVLPFMAGIDLNEPNFSNAFHYDTGEKRQATLDLRAGLTLAGTLSHASRQGIEFVLSEAQIDEFVNSLLDGGVSPQEIMKKGLDHASKHGHTLSFSLDLTGRVGVRAGVDLSQNDSNPSMLARGEFGATLTANLLSMAGTIDEELAAAGKRDVTNTKKGFLTKGSAAVGAYGQTAITANASKDGKHQINDFGSFTGAEIRASFEDSKTKQIDVQIKQFGPLNHDHVQKLLTTLESAFNDRDSLTKLAEIQGLTKEDFNRPLSDRELDFEKLRRLNTFLKTKSEVNKEQWAAINAVDTALSRALAYANHSYQLGEVKFSTTYTNLNRLDKESMTQVLLSHLSHEKSVSTAKKLQAFAANDPQLRTLMDTMKNSINARARVTMELKQDIKADAERKLALRQYSAADIALLMKDPKNLRIKDIKVVSGASLTETFTPLQILVGGGSISTVGMDKLIGQIKFHYGPNDGETSIPTHFSVRGQLAHGTESTRNAASDLAAEDHQQII
ncbi:AvrE-family type 3 secretion system effector [Pokkaliibacter sp. CJK22405]|uniref:AvrE-family type 3 secretion system effector n=1 Tax=Pokkaliibacter sp. CJK22405 TaxID=3384615 RepID=UPI0039853598